MTILPLIKKLIGSSQMKWRGSVSDEYNLTLLGSKTFIYVTKLFVLGLVEEGWYHGCLNWEI
jgi:hypothetical protein